MSTEAAVKEEKKYDHFSGKIATSKCIKHGTPLYLNGKMNYCDKCYPELPSDYTGAKAWTGSGNFARYTSSRTCKKGE